MPGLQADMMILADCSETPVALMVCQTYETQSSVVFDSMGVASLVVEAMWIELTCEAAACPNTLLLIWSFLDNMSVLSGDREKSFSFSGEISSYKVFFLG